MKINWHVVLQQVDKDNNIKPSKCNPKTSGEYLCTCIQFWQGKEYYRYLRTMEYDAIHKHWHDIGNPNGVSHVVLAWTNDVSVCDFKDFDYLCGILLEKK